MTTDDEVDAIVAEVLVENDRVAMQDAQDRTDERRGLVLEFAPQMSVGLLARALQVSEATIRSDIALLFCHGDPRQFNFDVVMRRVARGPRSAPRFM